MTIKVLWFMHLPKGEAQDAMKTSVVSAAHVLERLAEICYEKMEADGKSTTADYESPGWPYRQADKVGYARALQEVIDLTKISPPKERTVDAE